MACSTVVPKKWRDDTKDNCALTDASIRQAHKVGGGTRVMMMLVTMVMMTLAKILMMMVIMMVDDDKVREEAEWLIEERKNVTTRAQTDVKFRLTEKVTDTQR